MKKYHDVEFVRFVDEKLKIKIDGKEYKFELSAISEKLSVATEPERAKYEISPSGYGIHWPLIDEDLSIDALLGKRHVPAKIRKVAVH